MSRELEVTSKNLSDLAFSWHVLDLILGSKIVRPLYIWLIVVPILVRITSDLPERITLYLPNMDQIGINLDIPFSWKLLYFSGLALVLARTLYIFKCPSFVRDYKTAYSAVSSGMTVQHIRSIAADFLRTCYSGKLPHYDNFQASKIRSLLKQYRASVDDADRSWEDGMDRQVGIGDVLFDAIERVKFVSDSNGQYVFSCQGTYGENTATVIDREQLLKHLCWDLIGLQNSSYPLFRSIVSTLIIVSIVLLSVPFLQGVWFVVSTMSNI